MTKFIGFILILLGVVMLVWQIHDEVCSWYGWHRDIFYSWELADKSSTLSQKSIYINKFIEDLKNCLRDDYAAVFLKTPNNNFEKNLEALKSLGERLKEIQMMDVQSFAYQTAIQQITAQEQGEAKNMVDIFKSCWTKKNFPIVWDWWCLVFMALYIVFIVGGLAITLSEDYLL